MIRAKISAIKFYLQLNLFDWSEQQKNVLSQNYPASHFQRQYDLSPVRARLIIELVLGGHSNDQ
jgi:hypothetical protein